MPIYEYRCSKCGARFEHLARNSSDLASKCQKCGAAKPEKQLSTFSARVSEGHDHASGACGTEACGGCAASGGCPYGD
ncbi:MAG: zinc ribbon domain-containing protein [bacterium]